MEHGRSSGLRVYAGVDIDGDEDDPDGDGWMGLCVGSSSWTWPVGWDIFGLSQCFVVRRGGCGATMYSHATFPYGLFSVAWSWLPSLHALWDDVVAVGVRGSINYCVGVAPENGYSRIQTCSSQRREVLVDRDSELRSARYSSPSKSQKTKFMQTSSDCYREKQGVHNYLKRQVNTRSSPRSNTDVKRFGDGSIEFDERRWCSPKQKDTKIERLVIVDDTEVSERYPEGRTMRD
ncbi:hypothetical protein SUGI_0470250 [Cryptomeria japonica]|nr:hypothetical protein SUGI_0470250 [Cryptomeria japonica]